MVTLSLCLVAKEGGVSLNSSVSSVKDIVDEIVIVCGSSDEDAAQSARTLTENVFLHDSKDQDFLKNLALSKASSNWVFFMEQGEALDTQAKAELLKLVNDRENCLKSICGFKVQIEKSAGKNQDEIRIFKNHPKIKFTASSVEKSIVQNKGELIPSSIQIKSSKADASADNTSDDAWKKLEKEPENPAQNKQIADMFFSGGKAELALKYYLRTLKFNPNYPGIFADIGKTFIELSRYKEAIKFLNAAIMKNKHDVASMNNLAFIYLNLGKNDVAKKLLDEALSKDPKNKLVLKNYELLKKKIGK